MPLQLLLSAALPPMLWGTTYWLTTEVLWTDRPLTTALIRLLVPGLLLVAALRYWPRPAQWKPLLLISLPSMALTHACLFYAASRLAGPLAALQRQAWVSAMLGRLISSRSEEHTSELQARE